MILGMNECRAVRVKVEQMSEIIDFFCRCWKKVNKIRNMCQQPNGKMVGSFKLCTL